MTSSHASTIEAANATLLGEGDLDAVDAFFTADYAAHATEQEMAGGPPAIRRYLGTMRDAFPDMEVEVEILVESEDRIAWQRTVRATQKGAFRGFPATGERVVWRDMITSRLEDGRIAEEWVVSDLAERMLMARKR